MRKFSFIFGLFAAVILAASCTIGLGKAVDTEPPAFDIGSPTLDAVIRDSFAISGNWSDDGKIESILITLTNTSDSSKVYGPFSAEIDGQEDNEGAWKYVVNPTEASSIIKDGTYEATIVVTDEAKHSTTKTRQFSVDNTAPIIVLQRPSSKSDDTPDAYGQNFTLEGQAADDNDVSLIEVSIYTDKECTQLLHTVQLNNVPPTISLDVAKFIENTDNDYSKIYGSNKKDAGTQNRYVSIVAYDSAQRYPVEGNQSATDTRGNSTSHYYLYEDISTAVLSNFKITEVYHILNGTFDATSGERTAEKVDEVKQALGNSEISIGSFSLNPANNPHFVVTGRDTLKKDGNDFTGAEQNISNGSSVVVEVSTGLDAIPLKEDTLKVYVLPCDSNGKTTSTTKLYPETTKTKAGTSYKFVTVLSSSSGMEIGSNYVFGVEGTDQSGNAIIVDGNGYGFHLSSSGAAPTLSISSPADTITYLKKGCSQEFVGTVIVEEGLPTISILKGKDTIWTKTFTASDAKKVENGKEYSFSYTIPAGNGGFDQNSSSQNSYTVKASQDALDTILNKTVMYDVDGPNIDIQSVNPYAYKYLNEAGDEEKNSAGTKVQYLNGNITAKFSITDDFDIVDVSAKAPKYEFYLCERKDINANSRIIEVKPSNVNPVKQEITNINTATWKDSQGNQYKGPVTLKVTAYDRAGNESVAYADFKVDQETDKPVILPNSSTSVTFTYTNEETAKTDIESSGKNSFALGGQLLFKLMDDDGIKKVSIARQKKDKDPVNETPVDYPNYPTEIVYPYTLPSGAGDAGYYKVTITVEDKNGLSKTVGPFNIRITSAAPNISTVTANNEFITTATTNTVNPITQFENIIDISSTEAPFYIFRKDSSFEEGDLPLVKPADLASTPYYQGNTESDLAATEYKDIITLPANTSSRKITYYYRVYDKYWNSSNEKSVTVYVDNDAPEAEGTVRMPSLSDTKSDVTSFTFQGTVKDPKNNNIPASGIKAVEITITDKAGHSVTKTATGTQNWVYSLGYSADDWKSIFKKAGSDVADEGEKLVDIKIIDNAGNFTKLPQQSFVYDLADPTLEITSSVPTFMNDSGADLAIKFRDSYAIESVKVFERYKVNQSDVFGNPTENALDITKDSSEQTVTKHIPFGTVTDGIYSYQVVATDKAGNKKTISYFDVKVDKTGPTIAITSPTSVKDEYRNVDSYTFRGTITEANINSATISLYKDDSATATKTENIQLPTPVNNVYTWNWTATDLAEGKYKIKVEASDLAGNEAVPVESAKYVYYDKTLPVIKSTSSGLYSDAGVVVSSSSEIAENTHYYAKSAFTITPVITEDHYSSSNVKLTATRNGSVVTAPTLTESANGSKNWSFTTTPASDGTYVYTVTVTDLAGNIATESYTVIFDKTAPTVTITTPTPSYISDSNSIELKGSVSDSGIGLATLAYTVDNGSTWTPITLPNGTTDWTATYTRNAAQEGTINLKVKAVDKFKDASGNVAGNETTTDVLTFYYDKEAPHITKAAPAGTGVTNVNGGYYLKAGGTLKLSGTAYDTNQLKSITLSDVNGSNAAVHYKDVTITGSLADAKSDSSKITWTKELAATTLGNGTHTITVIAEDIAGRTSPEVYEIVVDITAPTVTSITCPGVYETPNDSFTFTGNASDAGGSALRYIYFGFADKTSDADLTNPAKFKQLDGSTIWAYTLDKTAEFTSVWKNGNTSLDGEKTVYVYAEDTAGNISSTAKTATFKYDTSYPELQSVKISGNSSFDLDLTEPKLSYGAVFNLEGSVFDNWEVASVTVTENTDTPIPAANISLSGEGKTKTVTISGLPTKRDNADTNKPKTGDYTYTINVVDKAGKKTSKNIKVSIDVSAPEPTITAPSSNAKNDKSLASEDYTFRGGVSDEGSSGMKAYYYAITTLDSISTTATTNTADVTDTAVWTKVSHTTTDDWSFIKNLGTGSTGNAVNTIYEGQHYLYVKAEDNAGNITPDNKTAKVAFYVDKAAPVISDAKNGSKSLTENDTFYYDDTTTDGKAGNFVLVGKILESNGLKTFTSKVDSSTAENITKPTASATTAAWSQTLTGITADTKHKVVITAQDNAERTAVTSTYYLYRDTKEPVISITNPDHDIDGTSALSWTTDATYTFRANVSDAGSGIKDNKYKYWITQIELSSDDAIKTSAEADTSNTNWTEYTGGQSFTKDMTMVTGTTDSSNLHEGKWYVYFYAQDEVGHTKVGSRYFWVDKAAPKVTTKIADETALDKTENYTDSTITTKTDKTYKVYFDANDTHGLDESFGITNPANSQKKLGIEVTVKKNTTELSTATSTTQVYYTIGSKDTNGYPISITIPNGVSGDDVYYYTIKAKDLAGKTTEVTRSVRLDTTGPVLDTTSPSFDSNKVSGWQTSQNVIVLGTATDVSGVKKVYYMLNPTLASGTTKPSTASWTGWTEASETTNWEIKLENTSKVPEGDSNKLWISSEDNYGNKSEPVLRTIKVDSRVPTLTETNVGLTGKKVTVKDGTSITLEGSFSDVTSGIATISIEDDLNTSSSWAPTAAASWSQSITIGDGTNNTLADGNHTLTITGYDQAGNKTTVQRSVIIDTQAPSFTSLDVKTTKSSYKGTSGTEDWYGTSSISIEAKGIEDTKKHNASTGIASVQYSTNASETNPIWISMDKDSTDANGKTYKATVNCPNQGANTITVKVMDAAGNDVTKEVTIYVDTNNPIEPTTWKVTYDGRDSVDLSDNLLVNGRQKINVSLNPTDGTNGSGIASISKGSSKVTTATNGVYTLEIAESDIASGNIGIVITDNVGKTTTWNPFKLTVDTEKPTVKFGTLTDADKGTTGTQVNKTISLDGTAKDTGGAELASIDLCYYVDSTSGWKHLETISSNMTAWTSADINTASAFGTLADGTEVIIAAIVTDTAGNRNLDTTALGVVTDNTTTYTESSNTYRIPSIAPNAIDAANKISIIVNQNTDRPLIKYTNLTEKDGKLILKFGDNSKIEGSVSDDDGSATSVVSMFVASSSQITSAPTSGSDKWTKSGKAQEMWTHVISESITTKPSNWSEIYTNYYTNETCTTAAPATWVTGTYYKKEVTTFNKTTGEYTFTPADKNDGTKTVYFYVKDNNNGEFYTGYTSTTPVTADALKRPYQQYKTEAAADNTSAITYDSDSNNPSVLDVSIQAYKDAGGNSIKVASGNLAAPGTSLVLGGTEKKYAKFIIPAYDANEIAGITLDLKYINSSNTEAHIKYKSTDSTSAEYTGFVKNGSVETSVDGTFAASGRTGEKTPYTRWTTDYIDISGMATGTIEGTVMVYDKSGLYGNSFPIFVADNSGPTITITSPSKSTVDSLEVSEEVSGNVSLNGSVSDVGNARASTIEWLVPTASQRSMKDLQIISLSSWNDTRADASTVANWKFVSSFLAQSKDDDVVAETGKGTYWTSKTDDGVYSVPVYFKSEDTLGNVTLKKDFVITYNPDADKPKTDIAYPSVADYDSGRAYVTLGGTIRVSGSVNIPSGITTPYAVYIQIANETGAFNATDKVKAGTGNGNYGYTVVTQSQVASELGKDDLEGFADSAAKDAWWGIKTNRSSNSWSINLNGDGKMNPSSGSTNDIKIRVCGVNALGKVGNWSDPVTIHIDNNAPSYEGTLYKYSTTYTSAAAYKDATPTEEKEYRTGMYLKGNWVLCVKISDEAQVKLDATGAAKKVNGSVSEDTNYYFTNQLEEDGRKVRYVYIPVSESATYSLTAYDMDSKETSGVHIIYPAFELNMDNTAPSLTAVKNSSDSAIAGTKVANSNYMTNFKTNADDGNGSGFKMLAYYFKRSATSTIELPLPRQVTNGWTAGTAYTGSYSGTGVLTKDSNLYGVSLTGNITYNSTTQKTTFTVSKAGEITLSNLNAYTFIRVGSIIKLEGSFYKISSVSGLAITVDTKLTAKTDATAFAAAAFVVDNTDAEVSSWANGIDPITNDDGDGVFEYIKKSGTTAALEFGVCADELDDGTIELCCVAFDEAGNYTGQEENGTAQSTSIFLANHTPRLSKVYLATDLNGNGKYSDDEFGESTVNGTKVKYFSALSDGGAVQQAVTITNGLNNSTTTGLTMRDKLGVALEFVSGYNSSTHVKEYEGYGAGNKAMYYKLGVSNAAISTAAKKGNNETLTAIAAMTGKFTGTTGAAASALKGFEIPTNTEGLSNYEITSSNKNNPTLAYINVSLWDSTPGTTPGEGDKTTNGVTTYGSQWTVLNIPLYVDITDDEAPVVSINNPQAVKTTIVDVSGDTTSSIDGHVDIGSTIAASANHKVSGKIVLTGTINDEKRISSLTISANKKFGTATTNLSKQVGYYNSTDGILAKTATGTDRVYSDNLGTGVDFDLLSQDFDINEGHTITWRIVIDTTKVESGAINGLTFTLTAGNSDSNASYAGTNTVTMDVVPYVTSVSTTLGRALNDSNESVYSRTAQGHYSVYDKETLTINGFNLKNATAKIGEKSLTVNSTADNTMSATLPADAVSGDMVISVGTVNSFNNSNSNTAQASFYEIVKTTNEDNTVTTTYRNTSAEKYNQQPNQINNNKLTDDLIFDIWEFKTAGVPRDGEILYPEMQIGPNGELGFAFVNGNFYFNMAGPSTAGHTINTTDSTFASQRAYEGDYAPYYESALAFDGAGRTFGLSTNQDSNDGFSAHTTFYFGQRATDKFGNKGWDTRTSGNYRGGAYRRRLQTTTSSRVGTQDTSVYRAMSPSLATTTTTLNNKTLTNVYIAFYDAVRKQIRYRYGTIGSSLEIKVSKNSTQTSGYTTVTTTTAHNLKPGDRITCSWSNNSFMPSDSHSTTDVVFDVPSTTTFRIKGDRTVNYKQNNCISQVTDQLIDDTGGWSSTDYLYTSTTDSSDTSVRPDQYSVVASTTATKTTAAVAIGAVPASVAGKTNDVVCIAWYDGSSRSLKYSYSENSHSDDGATAGSNFTAWTGKVNGVTKTTNIIESSAGYYVHMKVDPTGGIHMAYFTTVGSKLKYAYAPSYKGDFTVIDVDNYSLTANDLGLDVAKDANGNWIPYISYLSGNQVAKVAFPVAWNNHLATKAGISGGYYTGDWEISLVPSEGYTTTLSTGSLNAVTSDLTPKNDTICIGVHKNWTGTNAGLIQNIPTQTYKYDVSGDDTDSNHSVRLGGNGTSHPALAYTVVGDDSLQLAQMK